MVGCYQRTPRGTLGIFLVLSVLREVRPRIGSMSTYRICGDISCAASMRPAINRSIKIAIYGPGILAGTTGLKSVLFSRLRQRFPVPKERRRTLTLMTVPVPSFGWTPRGTHASPALRTGRCARREWTEQYCCLSRYGGKQPQLATMSTSLEVAIEKLALLMRMSIGSYGLNETTKLS
jgi:hypothetical protein